MKKVVFTPENLKYLKENYGDFPPSHFAEKFNSTANYISSYASKIGLGHSRIRKILGPHKDTIIDLYVNKKMDFAKISRLYNVERETIETFLKKNKIHLREPKESFKKYDINENFFETIDSESKAYFLGFMFADGNVAHTLSTVKLTVHTNDEYILHQFCKELGTERPLHYYKDIKCSNFVISNMQMNADLKKLGCVSNKSLVLKFPEPGIIPDHLMHHFIRGFFDGDGHVGYTEYKSSTKPLSRIWRFSITSTVNMLDGIQDILVSIGLPRNKLVRDPRCNGDISALRYMSSYAKETGRTSLLKIYEYLYRDATIFLHRKKEIFEYLFKFKTDVKGGPRKGHKYPTMNAAPLNYSFKSPNGQIFQGSNIEKFAISQGLDGKKMRNLHNGIRKNYENWTKA